MNIQDAIKSGRRFRRACFPGTRWYAYVGSSQNISIYDSTYGEGSIGTYCPDRSDIMAGDWEVEPKTVTITAADLAEAWKRATAKVARFHDDPRPTQIVVDTAWPAFARELGLTDEGSK